MFIDIHSHINNERLLPKIEEVLSNAKENNVGKIICVGCDYPSSVLAIHLAEKYPNVYASVGLHPQDCFGYDKKMEDLILSAKGNKKIVAIGEIGLEYYNMEGQVQEIISKYPDLCSLTEQDIIAKQKEVFIKQLELAKQISLPIMIHMRDATSDTLKILENNASLVENGGLLHCYNGSIETTQRVFNLGLYISLGGAITFKNSKNMPSVLQEIGLDRVTLETDCPYLCPEPFRGQENQPKNIPIIAQKITDILETSIENVEKTTTENCYKVFPRMR